MATNFTSKRRGRRAGLTTAGELPTALRNFHELPDDAYVRQPVVEGLFGISPSTVWRRVKDGGLPRPRRLSSRMTIWNVGELRRALRPSLGEQA
jgi:predicted DNA-binding transcriptional regulator AlpA